MTAASAPAGPIEAVVFDVGGVLVDWDPRHLYVRLIPDNDAMERFLSQVCTEEWHLQHDRGLSFDETIPPLIRAHPEWRSEIQAWGDRFDEMWSGPIVDSVALLGMLRDRGVPTYASTNWGAENWERAKRLFPFLEWFDGALVSGKIGVVKPDPRFYALLIEQFELRPEATLYVEDNIDNLAAAATFGFVTHHFVNSQALAVELRERELLDPDAGLHR